MVEVNANRVYHQFVPVQTKIQILGPVLHWLRSQPADSATVSA